MNKIQLIGNITTNLETRVTTSGSNILPFTIATNENYKDKNGQKVEKAEFHSCVAFGKVGELIKTYCGKGSKIYVEGKLQTRSWDDKNGQKKFKTEIMVQNIEFLSQRKDNAQKEENIVQQDDETPLIIADEEEIDIEQIPF